MGDLGRGSASAWALGIHNELRLGAGGILAGLLGVWRACWRCGRGGREWALLWRQDDNGLPCVCTRELNPAVCAKRFAFFGKSDYFSC